MKTLLVVDDHPIVLEGIQSVLSSNGYNVMKATNAESALSLARNVRKIDIFVIDLSLRAGTDGLDLIRDMREEGIRRPTIVYTMHEELWNIAALMNADIEGIVLKGDDISELALAVDEVADGRTYRSGSFMKCRSEVLNTNGILSAKDIEVVRRISKGENNKAISSAMKISEKAVEYHRANILRKLRAKTMFEATKRAIQLGIITCLAIVPVSAAATAPEAVDLGLSVKWADRNLGAPSPTEAGGFYAFGETVTKTNYDWADYSLCHDGSLFNMYDLGTECISGTEYDAARAALGNGWRLPTAEECEELTASTTCEISDDEIPVITFTASNGNSISFPLVGYMSLKRVVYEGREGHCWTGNLYGEGGEEDGFVYYMNSPFYLALTTDPAYPPQVFEGSCQLGFQIRPVVDSASSVEALPEASAIESVVSISGLPVSTDLSALPSGIYIIRHTDGTSRKISISNRK